MLPKSTNGDLFKFAQFQFHDPPALLCSRMLLIVVIETVRGNQYAHLGLYLVCEADGDRPIAVDDRVVDE